MKKKTAVLICLLVSTLCLSCRMVETLAGNETAGTVEQLWTDVPAIEDASKSDLAIPLGARLLIRAVMQGKLNFIAFTTNRSPQQVQNFYNKERMQAAGWKANEEGCISDTESKDNQGAICFFTREDGNKKEGLAIILAEDRKSRQTDIFYARIDLTEDASNSSTSGSAKNK